jgi:hypothetical protein
LDELVAFHQELGIFAILDELEVQRARAGVPDELRLAHPGGLAVCGASVLEWRKRGALSRTGCVTATRLGPGADPARQQWAASAPGGAASRVAALSSRYVARCGSRASESQRGCTRKQQECSRSMSGSSCVARSTLSMAVAWATTSVWWPWCVCQPPDHRRVATFVRAGLGERPGSGSDSLTNFSKCSRWPGRRPSA